MTDKISVQCHACGAVYLVESSERGKVTFCSECHAKMPLTELQLFRFRTSLGISDPITPFVAKKAIAETVISPTDFFCVDHGEWRPCHHLQVQWPDEPVLARDIQVVTYEESLFQRAAEACDRSMKKMRKFFQEYDVLATYRCQFAPPTARGEDISYQVFVAKDHLGISIETVGAESVDEIFGLEYEHCDSNRRSSYVIDRDGDQRAVTLPFLYANVLANRNNELEVTGRVRTYGIEGPGQGENNMYVAPHTQLPRFRLESQLVNRLLRTTLIAPAEIAPYLGRETRTLSEEGLRYPLRSWNLKNRKYLFFDSTTARSSTESELIAAVS